MTEEIQKDTLTGRQLKAAMLTAEDLTTDHEIALAVGVKRNSLARWKRLPEFQVAVEKYQRELEAAILKSGVASKVHRIRRMNKRWQELHEIAAQRASEAKTPESLMHGIAGAETGWVVAKETEVIGKKGEERLQVVEVEVDTALLKEIRDLEMNAAREMGGQFEDIAKDAGSGPGGNQRVQVNINFPVLSDAQIAEIDNAKVIDLPPQMRRFIQRPSDGMPR